MPADRCAGIAAIAVPAASGAARPLSAPEKCVILLVRNLTGPASHLAGSLAELVVNHAKAPHGRDRQRAVVVDVVIQKAVLLVQVQLADLVSHALVDVAVLPHPLKTGDLEAGLDGSEAGGPGC